MPKKNPGSQKKLSNGFKKFQKLKRFQRIAFFQQTSENFENIYSFAKENAILLLSIEEISLQPEPFSPPRFRIQGWWSERYWWTNGRRTEILVSNIDSLCQHQASRSVINSLKSKGLSAVDIICEKQFWDSFNFQDFKTLGWNLQSCTLSLCHSGISWGHTVSSGTNLRGGFACLGRAKALPSIVLKLSVF